MKKIISIILSTLLVFTCIGCGDSSKNDTKEEVKKEEAFNIETRFKNGSIELTNERNTDEAEKEIIDIAKEDATKVTDSEQIIAVVRIIKNNSVNPWADNETMEKMIYYGTLLDKSEKTTEEEKAIGYKAKSTVSFVYRNKESKEDATASQKSLLNKLEKYNY